MVLDQLGWNAEFLGHALAQMQRLPLAVEDAGNVRGLDAQPLCDLPLRQSGSQ
jgi:hypothetical protein